MEARKIKVLRVITRMNVGGPSLHVSFLAGLDPAHFETLLAHGSCPAGEAEWASALEAYPRRERIPGLSRAVRPWSDLGAFWRLVRLIRRERPDVVHTHQAKAGALGRLAAFLGGVPVRVHTFHGHVLEGYFTPWRTRAVIGIEKGLARISTVLLALSPGQKRDLSERFGIAPPERFRVVGPGLDLGRYGRGGGEEIRKRLGIPPSACVVGLFGRLTAVKEPGRFLRIARRVAAELPEARFLVVGDGELRPQLERQAAEEGLSGRVAFAGWQEELPPWYDACDAVALTSRNEGIPLALLEAMACGRPVVAAAVGGVPDAVPPEAGRVLPPEDEEAFTRSLIELARDPALRRRMGEAGRAWVRERFAKERLVRDLESLYAELLSPE